MSGRFLKKVSLIMLGFMVMSAMAFGQEPMTKDEKQINKCWKVYHKKGIHKGIGKLRKYMGKQEWPSLLAYESLVSMEFEAYNAVRQSLNVEISGETSPEQDSMVNSFRTIMADYYLNRFVNVCRRSTLESTSPSADMYLRQMLVDYDPDSLVSEKGKSYYNEAEAFYIKSDFELAELNYRKAISQDAKYYKANLYLGDSFWARHEYDSALAYYHTARELEPTMLEPRIYIIDALLEEELFYRAKKECIEALTVYPGYNLKLKLQRILNIENKYFNERRLMRSFYPNDMGNDEQTSLDNDPYWKDYRSAKSDVSKYCDKMGIIEENAEISDRYLEVYSIRKMLSDNSGNLPLSLEFADKMRKEGYLEPYVFISLFHVDIYPQFKDYMANGENREKTIEFVESYLIDPIKN